MDYKDFIPAKLDELYEIYNYRAAAQILKTSSPNEHGDLMSALEKFSLSLDNIRKPGGNESDIPKKISALLRNKDWKEVRIKGDLVVTKMIGAVKGSKAKAEDDDDDDDEETEAETAEKIEELKKKGVQVETVTRENFLDGHKVDYVKNRVAFDLEWNSKDQTFDRDLYAFRAFYECDLIDVGVLLTRSAKLNPIFEKMGALVDKDGKVLTKKNGTPKLVKEKYGASTTWFGKLEYRIKAGRAGGCPILVFCITPNLITDLHTL